MLVGIASGTYSSIFIASPVLTAWKEREPEYRARHDRIEAALGTVPAFMEEVPVAKVGEAEEEVVVEEEEAEEIAKEPVTARREGGGSPVAGGDPAGGWPRSRRRWSRRRSGERCAWGGGRGRQ